jgi:hypothetical protein
MTKTMSEISAHTSPNNKETKGYNGTGMDNKMMVESVKKGGGN